MRSCAYRYVGQVAENVVKLSTLIDHVGKGFHTVADYNLQVYVRIIMRIYLQKISFYFLRLHPYSTLRI